MIILIGSILLLLLIIFFDLLLKFAKKISPLHKFIPYL